MKAFISRWWTSIVLGILIGILASPLTTVLTDIATREYNNIFPILTAKGRVVYVDKNEIRLQISIEKFRDCKYVRLVAATIDATGQQEDANIRREIFEEIGVTRKPGAYDIGEWTVRPRSDGVIIQIDAVHICGNSIVRTNILKLPIPDSMPTGVSK
jgi:hypothetical protein